jgi:hypothetical protein
MRNVVITGATGAIGMALIEKLIQEKVNILILAHKNSNRNSYIEEYKSTTDSFSIDIQYCNQNEYKNFKSNKKYDVFYNFAWEGGRDRDNVLLHYSNVQYVLDAVDLAKRLGCHTFIGAGSQAEFGNAGVPLNDSIAPFPQNAFGASKLYAGLMSRFYAQQQGLRHIWARILSVYGPYDGLETMIISTIHKLLKKETPVFTAGIQLWDFIYSSDAANALYLLGEKSREGGGYCIGSGHVLPLRSYIEMIRDCIDPELKLIFGEIPYKKNDLMYLCADITDLEREFGFQPVVSFKEGIKKTIAWVQSVIE